MFDIQLVSDYKTFFEVKRFFYAPSVRTNSARIDINNIFLEKIRIFQSEFGLIK